LSSQVERKYLILLSLAIINDAIDLLGLLNQLLETILDVFTAALICIVLNELNPWVFILAAIDLVPGIDITPFWTIYILYRYVIEKIQGRSRLRIRVE